MSATSHTSGTLTGVTTPAGEEAWRLLQELLMNGEMQARMRNACELIGGPPSIVKTLFHLAPGEPVAMRELADRRVRTVVLTDRGAEARETVQQVMWAPPKVFAALTAAEQRELRDLVRKLVDADQRADPQHAAVHHTAAS
jgi:hypothetical protein